MPKHANCDQVLCGCGGLSGEPSLAVRQALTQALPERALRRQPLIRGPGQKDFEFSLFGPTGAMAGRQSAR